MTSPRSNNPRSNDPGSNKPMFRRLVRRLIFANRGRLFVILLALSAGAAVSAALLNLQTDAKRRINSEFRYFGANVLVTPRVSSSEYSLASIPTLDASTYERIPKRIGADLVARASLLYGVADATPLDELGKPTQSADRFSVVIAGYDFSAVDFSDIFPNSVIAQNMRKINIVFMCESQCNIGSCTIGQALAAKRRLNVGQYLDLKTKEAEILCGINSIRRFGGPEDNQVLLNLSSAQQLLAKPERISMLAITVPGGSTAVEQYIRELRTAVSDADVRPLRQFTEAQSRIYSRISGLLTAATAIILVLTALCVMAAMTNIAAERKRDVGMMKAIGGSARSILNLFLTEAALLGLAGGLVGAAAGIALSVILGKAVFGVAAAPRLIVYPISVALTVVVAILGAYPLRRLANVRPATVFRGEA